MLRGLKTPGASDPGHLVLRLYGTLTNVEYAAVSCVERLHQGAPALGNVGPVEFEHGYCAALNREPDPV